METTKSFKDFLRDYATHGARPNWLNGANERTDTRVDMPEGAGLTGPVNLEVDRQPLFVAHDIPKKISDEFRDILYTGQIQMVTMTLLGHQSIPKESHDSDQMFLFYGPVLVTTANEVHELKSGCALVVPAGTEHEIKNLSDTETKLISVYGRPEH